MQETWLGYPDYSFITIQVYPLKSVLDLSKIGWVTKPIILITIDQKLVEFSETCWW